MADRSGYIGRAPGDSTVIIARQSYEPTGVTTDFTLNAGYDPGYVDVYKNGLKLIQATEFNATDGSTVGLTSAAVNGDAVEIVAYKAFNLGQSVSDVAGNFDVGGNLTVDGSITVNTSIVGSAVTSNASGIDVTGVVTATSFVGDGSNLTGLAAGLGNVERLFQLYLEGGHKAVMKAYSETGYAGLKTMKEIEMHYWRGANAAAEAAKDAKVRRRAGNKEPRVTLIDLNHDAIRYKRQDMTGIIRRLFGNHLIWWFLPPTKYWHYIGMMSDIRGLLFGKKNLGTAYAYVKAMSLGLAGARAGSPVPFTRKARRRKFRKGLYTRAGYHRQQVGGSR